MLWIVAAGWIACGLGAAGFANAYEKARWPDIYEGRADLGFNLLYTIAGPFALVVIFFGSGFGEHGWSLSPKKPHGLTRQRT